MSDQLSLAEAFLDPRLGTNAKLARIDELIDWGRLGLLAGKLRQAQTGRPPYAALSMLKALYLQALYDLSDPGLEEALLDRLSFRRFCGFALDGGTPDETTLCRFRLAQAQAGVLEACFAEIGAQLSAKGLIRTAIVTSARTQDVEIAPMLICGDEAAVYADRGYESKVHRAGLLAQGIKDRIMHRRHKHIAVLPAWQQRRNALIARRRAPVEAVFSAMKRLYGKARTRCHSLAANTADLIAFATVYNLRRATIIAAG
ncbi:transposase [Boseaceae bacterium BT-24-1]|nr:transposase [Boseaceae bacterium BT-24-1]